jgi:hypothetical protein
VHWYPNEAADFKKIGGVLHALDPSGTRPVVSFGWNGGFAYFLDRPNPTPLSYGITTSTVPPEEAVRLIRTMEPAPFLIYTRAYERAGVPVLELDFGRWAQRLRGNVYATHDVPYFRQATAGCKEVGLPGDPQRPFFVIYDCAQALDGGE